MKTWEWWVPWLVAIFGPLITLAATRRSQAFKELTEVKNAYKMRVEELEKAYSKQNTDIKELKGVVSKMQTQIGVITSTHEGCKQALEYAEKRSEDLMKFFEKHLNGKPVNGLATDGPIS